VDSGLRIRQPIRGAYLDVSAGGFGGFEAEARNPAQFIGGISAGGGVGWHWERLEVGAEARDQATE
jgi:hypothetical protein